MDYISPPSPPSQCTQRPLRLVLHPNSPAYGLPVCRYIYLSLDVFKSHALEHIDERFSND